MMKLHLRRSLLAAALLGLVVFGLLVNRAAAQKPTSSHPILCQDMLLGGSRNGQWLTSRQAASATHNGERYLLYTLSGKAGKVTASKATLANSASQRQLSVRMPGEHPHNSIALDADWNAVPRLARVVSGELSAYKDAIRTILKQNGMVDAPVRLVQAVQVDLDGDGTQEVILTASSLTENIEAQDQPNPKYDYSFVAVLTGTGANAHVRVVRHFFAALAPDRNWGFTRYSLVGAADLNGDGKMEIVLTGGMYESSLVDVYTFNKSGIKRVLTATDGV